MQTIEAPIHQNRFENVDVLSMIDPQWLEHSQASRLIQMVAEAEEAERAEKRESSLAA